MALSVSQSTIKEGATATYAAVLKTESGTPLAATDIQTITLTYYNAADGTVINSRSQQNVKNTNDVTIDNSGNLTWRIRAEDTVIVAGTVASGETEKHVALFEFTWNSTFHSRHVLNLYIQQIDEVPLDIGTTLVTSWGGGTTNCYVSLTAANSFILWSIIDSDAWKDANTEKKIAALIEASRDIDTKQYVGTKKYSDQRLEFPRSIYAAFPWDYTNNSATTLSEAEERMQLDVEKATCHQALWLLQNSGRNKHSEMAASGVRRMDRQVGPIRETYDYYQSAGSAQRLLCPKSQAFLADWMVGRKVVRG